MAKKIGVVRFLGTNCDRDVWQALELLGYSPQWIWYKDHFSFKDYAGILLPGGFSHGDYLRSGALAARSPVMNSVREAAKKGLPVLGICNGFQILCESQLLPGALLANKKMRFIDRWVKLKLENPCFDWGGESQQNCRLPIAHGEGQFYIGEDDLKKLWDKDQVWWTYKDNPNGSKDNIAGVMNETQNVAGLMPHPERAVFDWMGSCDGVGFFSSL